ncbi:hypothetical protein B0T18DRAFT_50515 [Schizothecium vesticola]|uniref:Uncharacterized protein n=1 Tax=Schizothecium vesticola TaxID=314040 RepID=A0AA40FC06_9PEZI|nr:hypothetical protein B0T18DRAFT_50515 [Schizothecium vesticola]
MCRKSKRSDQSVLWEKKGGLASSMLKARSQARQTFLVRSAIPVVWPLADVLTSRLHVHPVHSRRRALKWASWQFKETRPAQPPTSGNLPHVSFISDGRWRWQWQSGQLKTRKRPDSGRVAAENFISPARFPRYWRSGTTKLVLAHLGRKPSAKPDPAKLELPKKPGPAPPVTGQSPGEFQGTRHCSLSSVTPAPSCFRLSCPS